MVSKTVLAGVSKNYKSSLFSTTELANVVSEGSSPVDAEVEASNIQQPYFKPAYEAFTYQVVRLTRKVFEMEQNFGDPVSIFRALDFEQLDTVESASRPVNLMRNLRELEANETKLVKSLEIIRQDLNGERALCSAIIDEGQLGAGEMEEDNDFEDAASISTESDDVNPEKYGFDPVVLASRPLFMCLSQTKPIIQLGALPLLQLLLHYYNTSFESQSVALTLVHKKDNNEISAVDASGVGDTYTIPTADLTADSTCAAVLRRRRSRLARLIGVLLRLIIALTAPVPAGVANAAQQWDSLFTNKESLFVLCYTHNRANEENEQDSAAPRPSGGQRDFLLFRLMALVAILEAQRGRATAEEEIQALLPREARGVDSKPSMLSSDESSLLELTLTFIVQCLRGGSVSSALSGAVHGQRQGGVGAHVGTCSAALQASLLRRYREISEKIISTLCKCHTLQMISLLLHQNRESFEVALKAQTRANLILDKFDKDETVELEIRNLAEWLLTNDALPLRPKHAAQQNYVHEEEKDNNGENNEKEKIEAQIEDPIVELTDELTFQSRENLENVQKSSEECQIVDDLVMGDNIDLPQLGTLEDQDEGSSSCSSSATSEDESCSGINENSSASVKERRVSRKMAEHVVDAADCFLSQLRYWSFLSVEILSLLLSFSAGGTASADDGAHTAGAGVHDDNRVFTLVSQLASAAIDSSIKAGVSRLSSSAACAVQNLLQLTSHYFVGPERERSFQKKSIPVSSGADPIMQLYSSYIDRARVEDDTLRRTANRRGLGIGSNGLLITKSTAVPSSAASLDVDRSKNVKIPQFFSKDVVTSDTGIIRAASKRAKNSSGGDKDNGVITNAGRPLNIEALRGEVNATLVAAQELEQKKRTKLRTKGNLVSMKLLVNQDGNGSSLHKSFQPSDERVSHGKSGGVVAHGPLLGTAVGAAETLGEPRSNCGEDDEEGFLAIEKLLDPAQVGSLFTKAVLEVYELAGSTGEGGSGATVSLTLLQDMAHQIKLYFVEPDTFDIITELLLPEVRRVVSALEDASQHVTRQDVANVYCYFSVCAHMLLFSKEIFLQLEALVARIERVLYRYSALETTVEDLLRSCSTRLGLPEEAQSLPCSQELHEACHTFLASARAIYQRQWLAVASPVLNSEHLCAAFDFLHFSSRPREGGPASIRLYDDAHLAILSRFLSGFFNTAVDLVEGGGDITREEADKGRNVSRRYSLFLNDPETSTASVGNFTSSYTLGSIALRRALLPVLCDPEVQLATSSIVAMALRNKENIDAVLDLAGSCDEVLLHGRGVSATGDYVSLTGASRTNAFQESSTASGRVVLLDALLRLLEAVSFDGTVVLRRKRMHRRGGNDVALRGSVVPSNDDSNNDEEASDSSRESSVIDVVGAECAEDSESGTRGTRATSKENNVDDVINHTIDLADLYKQLAQDNRRYFSLYYQCLVQWRVLPRVALEALTGVLWRLLGRRGDSEAQANIYEPYALYCAPTLCALGDLIRNNEETRRIQSGFSRNCTSPLTNLFDVADEIIFRFFNPPVFFAPDPEDVTLLLPFSGDDESMSPPPDGSLRRDPDYYLRFEVACRCLRSLFSYSSAPPAPLGLPASLLDTLIDDNLRQFAAEEAHYLSLGLHSMDAEGSEQQINREVDTHALYLRLHARATGQPAPRGLERDISLSLDRVVEPVDTPLQDITEHFNDVDLLQKDAGDLQLTDESSSHRRRERRRPKKRDRQDEIADVGTDNAKFYMLGEDGFTVLICEGSEEHGYNYVVVEDAEEAENAREALLKVLKEQSA